MDVMPYERQAWLRGSGVTARGISVAWRRGLMYRVSQSLMQAFASDADRRRCSRPVDIHCIAVTEADVVEPLTVRSWALSIVLTVLLNMVSMSVLRRITPPPGVTAEKQFTGMGEQRRSQTWMRPARSDVARVLPLAWPA